MKAGRMKTGKVKPAVISLGIILVLVSGILGSRGVIQKRKRQQQATVQPADASSPSKEYIYVGGRLISTEEPAGITLAAPTGLIATPALSPQVQVQLTWNSVAGADHYQVQRGTLFGTYSPLTPNVSGTSFTDLGVSAGTTFLYLVVALAGANPSPPSKIAMATPYILADPSLGAGTPIRAVHINDLRGAVDKVRAAAGLASGTYTDTTISPGSPIKAVDVQELRDNLDPALTRMGFAAGTYHDKPLAGVAVKAIHVTEIRAQVSSAHF